MKMSVNIIFNNSEFIEFRDSGFLSTARELLVRQCIDSSASVQSERASL